MAAAAGGPVDREAEGPAAPQEAPPSGECERRGRAAARALTLVPCSDSRSAADGTSAPEQLAQVSLPLSPWRRLESADPHPSTLSPQPLPAAPALTPPPCGEDAEGNCCAICLEAWTAAGEHRLAALRCGHLFGSACIQRWLKAQGSAAKCPQVRRSRRPGPGPQTARGDLPVPRLCPRVFSATRRPDARTSCCCTRPS